MLMKTFQYRLYPTKEQQRLLMRQLEECRWLWNTLLAERKQAWEERHETVDYYTQKAELPALKAEERPTLAEVHSQVLQDVVLRLKKAFDAFFRRLKAGENAGLSALSGRRALRQPDLPPSPGGLRAGCEGEAAGQSPKSDASRSSCIARWKARPRRRRSAARRRASGLSPSPVNGSRRPLPPTGQEVGIDVGLKIFAMPTEGDPIENPRFFRQEERALAKAATQAPDGPRYAQSRCGRRSPQQRQAARIRIWMRGRCGSR